MSDRADDDTPQPARVRVTSQKITAWGFAQAYLARLTGTSAVQPKIGIGLDENGDLAIWLPDGSPPEKVGPDEDPSQAIWRAIKRSMVIGGE